MKTASQMAPEELREILRAQQIARQACTPFGISWDKLDDSGADPRLIAEACETIGESHGLTKNWQLCAYAHRAACWFWRKAL